jgi:hypothetical protein
MWDICKPVELPAPDVSQLRGANLTALRRMADPFGLMPRRWSRSDEAL